MADTHSNPAATGSSAQAAPEDSGTLLPVLDLSGVVGKQPEELLHGDANAELARLAADCITRTGCLLVRDPRVTQADNDKFLDLMERYFGQSPEQKQGDVRADLHYQVGATPAGTEAPRCLVDVTMQQKMRALAPSSQATMPTGPDAKERFFWRVGPRPKETQFPELNAAPVIPQAFPEWREVLDGWGARMLGAVSCVAGLLAVGLGLPPRSIVEAMRNGPHLLAPTGSDLAAHGGLGTVFAGFHYDLNLMTIHGRSRFPGLYVWLRDGRRVPVRVPAGCLLLQAGKQLEWLTGGHVLAGMHEVVVSPETQAAVAAARAAGRSLWRVSSTVFAHVASDYLLQPLGRFAAEGEGEQQQQGQQGRYEEASAQEGYPPILAGEQVQRELEAICLRRRGSSSPEGAAAAAAAGGGAEAGLCSGNGCSEGGGGGGGLGGGAGPAVCGWRQGEAAGGPRLMAEPLST